MSSPKEKEADNVVASSGTHSGHRQRVKERILKNGFGHLYDHEILELLLFYAVPRMDVNPLAHELLNKFGDLKGVMDADVHQLATVSGMGTSSALLIKTVMEMAIRYTRLSEEPTVRYESLNDVIKYLQRLYFGLKNEVAYAMLFDNRMKLLDTVKLGEGTVNASAISMRSLLDAVIRNNAAAVILAHNHPNGNVTPSFEDGAVTRQIYDFLRQISIPLLEHIIVSGKEAYPIMRYSPQFDVERTVLDTLGENFWDQYSQF